MSMRKFKVSALAGTVLLMGSGVAFGDNPRGGNGGAPHFGGWWTERNGVISLNGGTEGGICATTAGFSCDLIAEGTGFKQYMMTPTGQTNATSYIATIVTDNPDIDDGASANTFDTSAFVDVSFVQMKINLGSGGNTNEVGITAAQRINETEVGGSNFSSVTNINSGWADTRENSTGSQIFIDQGLFDPGTVTQGPNADSDNFEARFLYTANSDSDGDRTGYQMEIDQVAGLYQADTPSGTDDIQVFTLRESGGDMQTTSGDIELAFGESVEWEAGQRVRATWIGQNVSLATSGQDGGSFGYLAFDNRDDNVSAATAFGLDSGAATRPNVWNDAFNLTFADTDPEFQSFRPCNTSAAGIGCP